MFTWPACCDAAFLAALCQKRVIFYFLFWSGGREGSLASSVLSESPPAADQMLCPKKRNCFSYLKVLPRLLSCFCFFKMENKHLGGFEMIPLFSLLVLRHNRANWHKRTHREIIARHFIGVFWRVRVRGHREYWPQANELMINPLAAAWRKGW